MRKEQMAALTEAVKRDAARRLSEELLAEYPQECAEVDLLGLIDHGIERAYKYDVATKEGIGRYVRLMLLLGWNFDIDPRQPWAKAILTSTEPMDPATRMNRLTVAAQAHE